MSTSTCCYDGNIQILVLIHSDSVGHISLIQSVYKGSAYGIRLVSQRIPENSISFPSKYHGIILI